MTQSILLRRSLTAGAVPSTAEFDAHTLVLNLADGLLYWRDGGGVVRSTDLLLRAVAKLFSPALTGTPTAPTAALGTNTGQIATMAALQAMRSDLVNGAGSSLDQLNELAAALGNDANFAATVTAALGNRLRGDVAATYTAAQRATFRSNLGITLPTGIGPATFSTSGISASPNTWYDVSTYDFVVGGTMLNAWMQANFQNNSGGAAVDTPGRLMLRSVTGGVADISATAPSGASHVSGFYSGNCNVAGYWSGLTAGNTYRLAAQFLRTQSVGPVAVFDGTLSGISY